MASALPSQSDLIDKLASFAVKFWAAVFKRSNPPSFSKDLHAVSCSSRRVYEHAVSGFGINLLLH